MIFARPVILTSAVGSLEDPQLKISDHGARVIFSRTLDQDHPSAGMYGSMQPCNPCLATRQNLRKQGRSVTLTFDSRSKRTAGVFDSMIKKPESQ